jgi:hypothetical protein
MSQEKLTKIKDLLIKFLIKTHKRQKIKNIDITYINEFTQAILQWFKEDVVPKKKETKSSTEADEISFLEDVEIMGYNQAIKDMLERLG